ncbi:36-mer N-terminal peptide of the N protein (N36) [Cedecea lapagei]|uniref:36-mer N-terminal peptide of the N protein (N36) n=1 Tax=Cedecea lapagei TaxID=158823 RepID=A0A3S5DPI9_9ENTR|nr:antitermination protein N [Cedecea lapagei]VEB95779.1 36-mer N-terminal peptide of the N protein (N36) [Cedecea lapagei]
MDAQARRRQRREAKQAIWKAANPLLVGVRAKPDARPIISLARKPTPRPDKALEVINIYGLQIIRQAEYHSRLRQKQDARQRSLYQAAPLTESGLPQASGKQTRRGKSIPLI